MLLSVCCVNALNGYIREVSTPTVPRPEVPYSALLGQLIKQLRLSKGIDQLAMAAALGISQSSYSRIESGDTNMNVWQLRGCAEQLGVSPSSLLKRVEVHQVQLQSEGVEIVSEKRSNPTAAIIGLAILAALLAS